MTKRVDARAGGLDDPGFIKAVREWTEKLEAMSPEERAAARLNHPKPSRPVPRPRVPGEFERATFENFKPHTSSQRAGLAMVRKWAEAVAQGDHRMLGLIGPTGVGKSHLAFAAAWWLYRKGIGAYVPPPWYTLADQIRYGLPDNTAGHVVRARLQEARIVILDELRKTAETDFDAMELTKFAHNARDNRVAVLATLNVADPATLMGEQAADRFTWHTIAGPSGRGAT